MAVDRRRGESIEVAAFYPTEYPLPQKWPLKRSPTPIVLRTGEPLIISDAQEQKKFVDYAMAARTRGYRTVVLLPMNVVDAAQRPMILSLHAAKRLELSPADLAYLLAVADLAGIAVEKGQTLRIEREANEHLGKLLAMQRSLIAQAIGESSLDSVVEFGRRFLKSPFIVADLTTGGVRCASVPAGLSKNEVELGEFLQARHFPKIAQLFRDLDSDKFIDDVLSPLMTDRRVRLVARVEPVSINQQIVGGLLVFTERKGGELAISTAGLIWMYLCIVLLRSHILLQSESTTSSNFIAQLLLGQVTDPADFGSRAAEIGLRIDHPHRLLAIAAADNKEGTAVARWAMSRIARNSKQRLVCGMLADTFVFVLPGSGRPLEGMGALAKNAVEEMRRTTGRKPLIVEGEICHKLSDYSTSWRRIRRNHRVGPGSQFKWARDGFPDRTYFAPGRRTRIQTDARFRELRAKAYPRL